LAKVFANALTPATSAPSVKEPATEISTASSKRKFIKEEHEDKHAKDKTSCDLYSYNNRRRGRGIEKREQFVEKYHFQSK